MRRIVSFGVGALSVIAIALLAFWAMGGFRGLGLDTAGAVALVLGMLFTSALGAVLMVLVFYSDRSNADEGAYRAADGPGEGPSADRRTGDGDRP
jgi:hypothetical protein